MKIVVCPDSFKGSLSAENVAKTISSWINKNIPDVDIVSIPLADGGEGTADIVSRAQFPVPVSVKTHDPLGREIETIYFISADGKKAFIESAKIIGLPLLSFEERDPLVASSQGLGEVINDAVRKGCNNITVSLGGSATCDAGEGMMTALKYIPDNIDFSVVCDVNNPLLGPLGAVRVFAPQKGAKTEDLPVLEAKIENFVLENRSKGLCNPEDIKRPGSGAAGGLGFAFMTLLKAKYSSGIDFIFNIVDFENQIKDANLIITGEGKIDAQSSMGKVVGGVLKVARKYSIPVIAIGGLVEDKEELIKNGLSEVYEIIDRSKSLEDNLKEDIAINNINRTIDKIFLPKSNIFKQ